MQYITGGVCLLPWTITDNLNPLLADANFPNIISQLSKYFKDIRATGNGPIWTKIRIGLPTSAEIKSLK